jgi:ATP-dependent Lon protease
MNENSPSETLVLPVFPLRNSVLFPLTAGPYSAGRKGSVAALERAAKSADKSVIIVAQQDPGVEDPGADDL